MLGVVGAGGEKPPATRLYQFSFSFINTPDVIVLR